AGTRRAPPRARRVAPRSLQDNKDRDPARVVRVPLRRIVGVVGPAPERDGREPGLGGQHGPAGRVAPVPGEELRGGPVQHRAGPAAAPGAEVSYGSQSPSAPPLTRPPAAGSGRPAPGAARRG